MNAVSWLWNFGNSNISNQQNPNFEYTQTGSYTVVLIVTSAEGCTDTAISYLVFEEQNTLYIPSAFTPNDDGINPIFFAYSTGIREFSMEIFDRWGERIFVSNDIQKGWNGLLQSGTEAPQGVYTYKIDVLFSNNKSSTFLGKLTMIK